MAPEVCLGQIATPASDQYSLACMAYEMLSGKPPFSGDAAELRQAQVEASPTPLRDAVPGVSAPVAAAVEQALAKAPVKRFPDIRAFVRGARTAEAAFERSESISHLMARPGRAEDKVGALASQHGLSDGTISQLTDLDRTEVVRLRRRQARQALVGRRPT